MMRKLFWASFAAALASACSSGSSPDAGVDAGPQSCTFQDASYPINCSGNYNAGWGQDYNNNANTIGVSFSGETLGVDGLPYVPNLSTDPVFVDGWSVQFYEYIVVIGNIRLDSSLVPGTTPQYDLNGTLEVPQSTPAVLRPGPYVIDAHQVHGLTGKDGVEPAQPLFLLSQLDNGQSFDPSTWYAWSYDVVQAQYPATNVNLADSELPDYALMVQHHWTKMIRGLATHTCTLAAVQGGGTPTQGTYTNTSDPNAANAQALFDQMPTAVYFAYGWDDAAAPTYPTLYHNYNCVNPDNGNGVEDNVANCGVQTNPNSQYVAQITIHTDHLFWDTLQHEGEPLRFDPIAAYAPATTQQNPFWINDLTQQLATTFNDGKTPLPDRGPYMSCPGSQAFTTDMPNNGTQVIMNPNGVPSANVPDYADFMIFSVESQTHLNAQGICYITGQHPSDPFGGFFSPNNQAVQMGPAESSPTSGVSSGGSTSGGSTGSGTTGGSSSSATGGTGSSGGATGAGASGGSSGAGTTG